MARCLVLGADGFIGSHLCDALSIAGHDIRAFDRLQRPAPKNLNPRLKNLELFPGDFLNRTDLDRALEGIEYVFHLVSTTNPATSSKDPFIDIDTNLRMSVELLSLCAKHDVRKVIFPSTGGAIYGRGQADPLKETDVTAPISPYAIGKLAIEGYLRYFHETYGLDYLTLRVSNPYGERQNVTGSQGVIPIFLNLVRQDLPLTVFGDGSMVRDYIYVKDLVNIIAIMFERPLSNRIYNLGSGESISITELIAHITKITGKDVRVRHADSRPTDAERVLLDTTLLRKEVPEYHHTPLNEGLLKTWQYVNTLEDKAAL